MCVGSIWCFGRLNTFSVGCMFVVNKIVGSNGWPPFVSYVARRLGGSFLTPMFPRPEWKA